MKSTKKFISILLLVVGIFALCLGCMEVIRRIRDTQQTSHISSAATTFVSEGEAETASETLAEIPTKETVESTSEPTTEVSDETTAETPTETTSETEEAVYVSPYADYFTKYPDMVAWFQIPGTNIDYPVMWTPGDETYYLYRHYDGSDNINGSLLLDTDSSLSPLTTNLIIHGHNMKSGAMFGNLPQYGDKNYYEQHKEMLLFTPDGERTYEIVAVFRSQVYKKSDTCFKFYKFFQADTENEFNDFYDNIKALSLYDTGVTAQFGDHFITLSTCVSHVENGRFVVVAKETTVTVSSE
jgi:sortase B